VSIILLLPRALKNEEEVEKLLFVRQSNWKEFTTRVNDSFSRVARFVERERERISFSFLIWRKQTRWKILNFLVILHVIDLLL